MNNFSLINRNKFFLQFVRVIVWRQVFKLTEQEQLVIFYMYWRDRCFKEIENDLSLSKGRISQIHSAALLKLKHSGTLSPLRYV